MVTTMKRKKSYADMACVAIETLKDPSGCSVWAIEKFIISEFPEITYKRVYLTNALKKGLVSGRLQKHPQHASSYIVGENYVKTKIPRRKRLPKCSPELRTGDLIRGRYQVINNCGKGSFGYVLHCWDRLESRDVAIKVSKVAPGKSSRSELVTTMNEYKLLCDIDSWQDAGLGSPPNSSRCVKAYEAFEEHGLVCLVLEKLGTSVVSFLRVTQFVSLPMHLVRAVGRQVLEALRFLHAMGVAHLDVKPHNMLFTSEEFTAPTPVLCADGVTRTIPLPVCDGLKLIDFGGSRYIDDQDSGYTYTTEFRAPELVFDLDFSTASDMWAVGCVLLQLYTGQLLFRRPTGTGAKLSDHFHLAQMATVLGPFPRSVVLAAQSGGSSIANACFDHMGFIRPYSGPGLDQGHPLPLRMRVRPEDSLFLDLLERLLRYEPEARISATECLAHPFFAEEYTRPAPSFVSKVDDAIISHLPALPHDDAGGADLIMATDSCVDPAIMNFLVIDLVSDDDKD